MNTFLLVSSIALWAVVFVFGFLLLGTLRSLGMLGWRFDELEATRPVRKGREGLPPGKRAPDFTLPSNTGGEVSLHDFAGRKVLLVFTQSGCDPCHDVMPELNRIQEKGEHQVLVVNNAERDETHEWADGVHAQFPVLAQESWSLSKRYQIFATPFAFLIDEHRTIVSKGTVGRRQYLDYVLSGVGSRNKQHRVEAERESTVERESAVPVSSKEVTHV